MKGKRSERPVSGGPSQAQRPRERFLAKGVRVVHEDDDVLVVDKPAGMVTADPARTQGAPRGMRPSAREGETLFDYVKKHVRAQGGARRGRDRSSRAGFAGPWIVHRLDKEASGLLVFAKSERAYESLKEQLRSKSARRVYIALAEGEVGPPGFAGTRESMIEEDRGAARDQRPRERVPAVTHYEVIGAGNGLSLLRVRLETGRKNQIRIHMRELGHSLAGDRRFGARGDAIGRLGLHAAELGFKHPERGTDVAYESAAPVGFYRAVGMSARAADHDAAPNGKVVAQDTSWEPIAGWYDTLLEDRGSDHYERIILPGVVELLGVRPGMRVLDVACGQGILARRLAAMGAKVVGVDASPGLIEAARKRSPEIEYHVGDARALGEVLPARDRFDAASCVMALANIDPLEPVLRGITSLLKPGGVLVAAIVHPAFRVPGQSDWGWDEKARRQYRRIDAYLTPFRKEMTAHPGKAARNQPGGEIVTPTFHRPLGDYIRALGAAGLAVTDMREWVSERAATSGPRAAEENRARREFPLFLAIKGVRV